MTGRLMLGVGVNSDAGLVGNFVYDEQNFDITRLPRSWEDFRTGTALPETANGCDQANPGTVVQLTRSRIKFRISITRRSI